MIKNIYITLLILFLSGCSVFPPVNNNYKTYVLDSTPNVVKKPYHRGTLYVSPFTADPLYESNMMAYSTCQHQVDYYAKNRWLETPAQMLETLTVKSLQATKHFAAVTTTAGGVRHNYVLNVNLVELRQIYTTRRDNYINLTLHAEIVSSRTGKIIANKTIVTMVPANCPTPTSGVIAANRAAYSAIDQLVNFCVGRI